MISDFDFTGDRHLFFDALDGNDHECKLAADAGQLVVGWTVDRTGRSRAGDEPIEFPDLYWSV